MLLRGCMKGANFISEVNGAEIAFVTTNSICQGQQVLILWPIIFGQGKIQYMRTPASIGRIRQ